jgi:hypothetical protein
LTRRGSYVPSGSITSVPTGCGRVVVIKVTMKPKHARRDEQLRKIPFAPR